MDSNKSRCGNDAWNRCDVCGRFIPYKDFDIGAVRRIIDPDCEIYETLCVKHVMA